MCFRLKWLHLGSTHLRKVEARGDMLLVSKGCTPKQAYHEMADFLTKQGTMLISKHIISEPPEELEEELRRPIKKLKGLVQNAAMTEQVQSLISSCSSVEDQFVQHMR
ncbi:hypothetical protein WJX77_003308 [Trebouxia sp. C0004]